MRGALLSTSADLSPHENARWKAATVTIVEVEFSQQFAAVTILKLTAEGLAQTMNRLDSMLLGGHGANLYTW